VAISFLLENSPAGWHVQIIPVPLTTGLDIGTCNHLIPQATPWLVKILGSPAVAGRIKPGLDNSIQNAVICASISKTKNFQIG
jgi:hypothetical protein